MKKILTALLSLTIMFGAATPVFAADTTVTNNTDGKKGTTTVNYTVSESFEFTIPTTVTANATADSDLETVSITKNIIGDSRKLEIKVSSTNGWKLKKGEKELAYVAYLGSDINKTALSNGAVVITKEQGEIGSEIIKIKSIETPGVQYFAGTYSDTLTFTATVEDV